MGSLLCSLWQFVLKAVEAVVDGVGELIRTIATVLLDIASELWDSTIGSGRMGPLLLIGGAIALVFLLGGRRNE